MDATELIQRAPSVVSIVAAIGILLLLPLYFSQRRDVRRLREWMAREPGHPAADIAASEAILDRAEAELEELLGETPEPGATPATGVTPAAGVTPPAGVTPSEPLPAAARVTSERPALERVTMERAALAPHPRWRRFVSRATQPRVLVVLGIVALLVAAGAIVLSESLLTGGEDSGRNRVARIDRADVTVAVLNGTAESGLANKVGSDVGSNGYQVGRITNTASPFAKTVVFYTDGQKAAAQKVARDLGLDTGVVEAIDRETRLIADDADVVVVVGEDGIRS